MTNVRGKICLKLTDRLVSKVFVQMPHSSIIKFIEWQQYVAQYPFIHLGEERQNMTEPKCHTYKLCVIKVPPSKPFKHALTIQAVFFFIFVTIINITILKHLYNNMVG